MEKLYDIAARGDVRALLKLLEKDPFLLERASYTNPNNTPLHIAAMKGHVPFVEEILNRNPHLAEELNSQQSSPLHLASVRGHVEIAKKLVDAAPDMCLSLDSRGRNPLHLAAVKGHVEVLQELVPRAPLAAREKVDRGLTVLHLCVKHGQLETLKVLMKAVNELINVKNDDGDTILHLAVVGKKFEIMEYLFESTNINVNTKNSNGQTAKAIYEQIQPKPTKSSEATKVQVLCHGLTKIKARNTQPEKWLTKKRDSIMVVAVLIATMAFQVGVTPAGGVWQEDFTHHENGTLASNPHRAGEAVMAHNHPRAFKNFTRSNTVAFVSSLSTILLLISGLPFRRPLFMWILMMIMWLTVTSVAVTYAISIVVVTPKKDSRSLSHVIEISLAVWCGVMGILLVGNTVRLIDRWLKNRGVFVWRPRRFRNLVEVSHENGGVVTLTLLGRSKQVYIVFNGGLKKIAASLILCSELHSREKMELLRLLDLNKQEEDEQTNQIQLKKLLEAALTGSVQLLSQILKENPQILRSPEISSMPENPLHAAALLGHLEFAKKLLCANPELSKSLNSTGSSALHLAAAKGNAVMVKELVSADSSMCGVRDREGRIPLHLAAIKGRTAALEELLREEPAAAAALTVAGESCLHLCVKYNRVEAMKVILQFLERENRLVDWKDENGNTVLHLAVAKKQIEMVEYLMNNTRIEHEARNANGLTPLDLLLQSPGDLTWRSNPYHDCSH